MATYIFGDLHGCFDEFSRLLKKIKFKPGIDELLVTGDLIGRGPKPLETLKTLMKLKTKYPKLTHLVLGNHDLNFLAVAEGFHKAKKKDNLAPVLEAANLKEIIEFYKSIPLIYVDDEKKLVLTHAGLYPMWSIEDGEEHGKKISRLLNDPLLSRLILANMYGDLPNQYYSNLKNSDLAYWRFIISSFTRMRLCSTELILDYKHSDCSVEEARRDELYPWFDFTNNLTKNGCDYTLFFGHWAALQAKCDAKNIVALDTGVVWGNKLTCYCLEDKKKISVSSNVKLELIKKG